MRTRFARMLVTMAAAALLLTAATTAVSARSWSISETGFRITWNSIEFGTSTATIRCRVTLEGTFHSRTIAKVARSLIGYINSALFAHPCTGGEAWMDNGREAEPLGTAPNRLPFHLTYESFGGTLPRITELKLLFRNVSWVFQTSFLGIACRARYGRLEDNIIGHAAVAADGTLGSMAPDATTNRFSRVDQLLGSTCPTTLEFRGSSNSPTTPGGGAIRVTLI